MRGGGAERRPDPPARRIARLEEKNLALSRALQLLEEARANLVDQYDYAPLGFVTLDAKGCVCEMNLTAARMLERKRSGLLTMPFFPHVAKPSLPDFLHHLRECRARQQEVVTELSLRVSRIGALPVELRSVPVPALGGSETVYRTIITDITERQRADRALRESEQRYRDLVERSPDGIFILNNGLIVFVNSAALRICGVENRQELLHTDFIDCLHPPDRETVRANLQERSGGAGERSPVEAKLVRRGVKLADVELAVREFQHDGDPAIMVVTRDITRRRRAERQVLEISEHERRTFGRDVHDSLCQSLTGAAYLAEHLWRQMRELSSEAAAQANEIAGVIRQCAEEARTLARGLCPVTMGENGLVTALHELTAEVARRSSVECLLEFDDHQAFDDSEVATNLYRIAQEAVTNAIKHGRPKSILIQLANANGSTTLRVRDDGKGIRKRSKQSGMGLHTMQYRATIIGGTLDVRPARPRGTVVTCSLPTKLSTS
ncbi:MAG: PAS domain S-box protein [Chthoniobacteraceae bacterium]